jgi:hypothetical protein
MLKLKLLAVYLRFGDSNEKAWEREFPIVRLTNSITLTRAGGKTTDVYDDKPWISRKQTQNTVRERDI